MSKPFIGVRLDCANAYVRCYKDRKGRAYTGRCPKCFKALRFAIGAGGTSARFFAGDCRTGRGLLG
jgi:hypothetical protein